LDAGAGSGGSGESQRENVGSLDWTRPCVSVM
jgi:hypothetical protein